MKPTDFICGNRVLEDMLEKLNEKNIKDLEEKIDYAFRLFIDLNDWEYHISMSNCLAYVNAFKRLVDFITTSDEKSKLKIKIMYEKDFGLPNAELYVTKKLGQFDNRSLLPSTRKNEFFTCIDSSVTGNVFEEIPHHYTRIAFIRHCVLSAGEKYYDPTLRAIYTNGLQDCFEYFFKGCPDNKIFVKYEEEVVRRAIFYKSSIPQSKRLISALYNNEKRDNAFFVAYKLSDASAIEDIPIVPGEEFFTLKL